MIKKIIFIIVILTMSMSLLSCQQEILDNEEITFSGLEEANIYIGDTFDFMEGVEFISSTRGDITSTVTILETVDLNQLGVSIITYKTLYENNEEFTENRKIVVLNAPDTENMIINGDYTTASPDWHVCAHASYPSEVLYILDSDLKRMQVIIRSATDNVDWPHVNFPPLTLSADQTYTFSILVSGTIETFFTVDIVETTGINEVYEITANIIDPVTVPVGLDSNGMQLFTFNFTPNINSTNAKLRLMFGGLTTEEKIIYMDNIHMEETD